MKRKPDIVVVLAVILGMGVLVSNYTMGQADPESIAEAIVIR